MALIALALAGAVLIHLAVPATYPGIEWDEAVYACMIDAFAQDGQIRLVADHNAGDAFYGYHPPFYFWIAGLAAGLVETDAFLLARRLNLLASLAAFGGLALYIASLGRPFAAPALAALMFVLLDSWTLVSFRIGWFENTQFLLVCACQAALIAAIGTGRMRSFVIVGVLAGSAIVFKHIGGWIILQIAILAIVHRNWRGFGAVLVVAGSVCLSYVVWQVWRGGEPYIRQTLHQLARAAGETSSLGVNFSLSEAVAIAIDGYLIFTPTLVCVGVAGIIAGLAYLRALKLSFEHRNEGRLPSPERVVPVVLSTWLMAAALGLLAIKLRNPHYYFLVFTPAMFLLGYYLAWSGRESHGRGKVAALVVAAVFILQIGSIALRAQRDDQVIDRFVHRAPAPEGSTLLSEEPIACLHRGWATFLDIRIGANRDPVLLENATISDVVLLSSRSYDPPRTPEWDEALADNYLRIHRDHDAKWSIEAWRRIEADTVDE